MFANVKQHEGETGYQQETVCSAGRLQLLLGTLAFGAIIAFYGLLGMI